MRLATIALAAILSSTASFAQDCAPFASKMHCDSDISPAHFGSSTIYSDGSTTSRFGDTTILDDGSSATTFTEISTYSDGTSSTRFNRTAAFSNGRTCTRVGTITLCK